MRHLCVEPDAPWATCCVCGKKVKTCGREVPVPLWPGGPASDYTCPVHYDGFECCDGRWVCSQECGGEIDAYFEGKGGFFRSRYFSLGAFIRRFWLKRIKR